MIQGNILITDLETLIAAQDGRVTTNADPEKVKEVEEFLDNLKSNPKFPTNVDLKTRIAICHGEPPSSSLIHRIMEMENVSIIVIDEEARKPNILVLDDLVRPPLEIFPIKSVMIDDLTIHVKSSKDQDKPWYDRYTNKRRGKKKR